ncbi:MAG: family peptidase, partial [Actinomycetota bacterium]|nr:family peptidase [Actinomycetota bacterium]
MFHEFGDSAGRPGRQHRIARRRAVAWVGRWATWLLAVAVGLTGPAALASHATPVVGAPGAAPAADVPSVDWGDWTAGPLPLFGPAPADGALTVYLALVGPAGPEDLATRVSDPTSTDYGDYVTLAQATAQFGATPATRQAVTDAVTAAGGTVTFGPVNTYVRATFSVAQAEDFFDTTFGLYSNTLANG